jgi:hypothetical protein
MFQHLTEKLSTRQALLILLGTAALVGVEYLLEHEVYPWLGIPLSGYPDRLTYGLEWGAGSFLVAVMCKLIGISDRYPRTSAVIAIVGGIVFSVIVLWLFRGS